MGLQTQECDLGMANYRMKPLTETEIEEIERMARENTGEPYRGPLLALVDEVRRLRRIVFES